MNIKELIHQLEIVQDIAVRDGADKDDLPVIVENADRIDDEELEIVGVEYNNDTTPAILILVERA